MTLHSIILFFVRYKYIAIFPVAVLEGPIISIISGFLVSRGALAFIPAFIIVFLGDLISDSFFYFMGRGGKRFIRERRFFKITDERITSIERQYEQSPWKTMIVAKVSYGLGMGFMVTAGVSKMSYKNFLWFAGVLNAIRSLGLLFIGYYFGKVAVQVGPEYIWYYTVGVCILVPALYGLGKLRGKNDSR